MSQKKLFKGYVLVIASAIIYGCTPLMAKSIYAEGVNAMTLVFLRNILCLPVLAALAHRQYKTLAIPLKLLPEISVIAILGCCATPLLLFISYSYIASGTATVLHYIYPVLVVLGEMIFLRKKVPAINLFSIAVCVFGVFLFYTPAEALDGRGTVLALLSGFTFAAYIVLLGSFKKHNISGFLLCFYTALVSCVVMFAVCVFSGQLSIPTSAKAWALCTLLSFAVSVGAVYLFQQGTFITGGARASVLSTLEPITSLVIGLTVLSEHLSRPAAVGASLVIAASILIAFSDLRAMSKT